MPESDGRAPFIDQAVFEAVVEGVRLGKYHLVLGAGASQGCRNATGPLPMAEQLERILLEAIGLPNEGAVGLPRALESAYAQLGREEVGAMLRRLFAGAEPLEWHLRVPQLAWEAIWTLNVDDVIERAYELVPQRRQLAVVRLWDDTQLPYGGQHDDVPVVHLHGYVGEINRRGDPKLVFDWQDYVRALRQADQGNWQTRFRGDYEIRPMIIVGARLSEELDFLEVVRRGSNSARFGLPSIIVRPSINAFDKQEYERWGLVPVSASAEEFIGYLADAVGATDAEPVGETYETRYTLRVFLPLTPAGEDFLRPEGHDFYGGHAPEWLDILEGLDAVPKWIANPLGDLGSPESCGTAQALYLLKGPPFCGKSTGLLRLAHELGELGWQPVLLVGHERIEFESTLKYFETRPRAVLLIDGLTQDAGDVGELLRRAEAAGQRLFVFAAERERHLNHIRNTVPAKYLVGVETALFMEPTNALWLDILRRRQQHARLGRLEGASDLQRQFHFVEHGRELFSALATLEDATGFIDRGLEAFRELDGSLQTVFCAVGLLGSFGLPAPLSAVSAASGVRVRSLVDAIAPVGDLSQWMVADPVEAGCVRLRHRYLGDLIVSNSLIPAGRADLGEIAQNMCLALADEMSPKTIRRKTVGDRIVAALMDLETVRDLCRSTHVDGWYAALETAYGWSARYWEQRALGLANTDRAYSYAKRAVSLHPDSFTLNTLGTVIMRRAASSEEHIGPAQRKSYWKEALDALVQSREEARGRFEHPYVTFFSYTARILNIEPNMDREWHTQAEQAYRDWRSDAARHGFFDEERVRRLVAEFPADWRR